MSTTPIQLPALEPPKYYSPLDARAKLMNLQNLALQQQEGQQRLQSGQLTIEGQQHAIAQRQAIDQAFKNAWKLDENGKPKLDENGKPQFDDARFSQVLSDAGFGSAGTPILEANTKYRKSLADLDKVKGEVELAERNSAGHLAAGVQAGDNDPHLYMTHVTQAANSGALTPAHAKALMDPVIASLQEDPTGEKARALVKNITDQMIAGSPKERELATSRVTADATAVRDKAQATLADISSLEKGMGMAAQSMPVPAPAAPGAPPALPTQEEWDAWRNGVTDPRVKDKIPPKVSATSIAMVNRMALTREQQQQADQAKATLEETKKRDAANMANSDVELQTIATNPNETPERRAWAKAALDLGIKQKLASRPVNENASAGLLDRESARFAKPHEKAVTDANAQLEKISEARSMINGPASAQALGIPKVLTAVVSGAGSGVRITQAELNSIAQARGIAGGVEGFINQVSGQGKLTAEQKRQLTQVLDDVADRIRQKQTIANDALDKINSAGSRDEIVRIDSEARRKLGESVSGSTAKPATHRYNPATGKIEEIKNAQ